ncbi:MAG: glycosyltransferase, partial [Pseudomonadota bacterium]
MSKTILQVIPELQTGGAERTVLEVSQAIIESGGTAIVFTNGGRMEAELAAMGGTIIHGDAKSKNPFVILKTNVDKLVEIIKKHKVDIVHARSRAPAISACLAARKC